MAVRLDTSRTREMARKQTTGKVAHKGENASAIPEGRKAQAKSKRLKNQTFFPEMNYCHMTELRHPLLSKRLATHDSFDLIRATAASPSSRCLLDAAALLTSPPHDELQAATAIAELTETRPRQTLLRNLSSDGRAAK